MKYRKISIQYPLILFFSVIFIVFYFFLLNTFFLIPNKYSISIVLLIGFAVIIIVFFFFANLNPSKKNRSLFKFKGLSEKLIQIILVVLMSITIYIPPISFSKTIIDWHQIGIFNYFRAISFLIGCVYLPGSNLYNIFFSRKNLHERFKVEPFLLKLTLYPLLSLMFLGISTLILEQLGLLRHQFIIVIFFLILGLFLFDLIFQKVRYNHLKLKIIEIEISKYSFFILLIALGVILISIGVQISAKYLIPGDSWTSISSAKYIGILDASPIDQHYTSAIYWGYISFALSVLSGLPYININVFLAPLCYLSITSLYLLIKSILHNYNEIYSVLSVFLIATFSGLFFLWNSNFGLDLAGWEIISILIFDCIFNFRYKSYAYLLICFSIALFIIISKTEKKVKIKKILKTNEYKILILTALFFLQSYMVYFIIFFAGIYIIFFYCLFSEKKDQNFYFLLFFIFFILFFFINFDILTKFKLSSIILNYFLNFVEIPYSWPGIELAFLNALLIYSILIIIFLMSIIFFICYIKFFHKKRKIFNKKFPIKLKSIFILIMTIFSVFLLIMVLNFLSGNINNLFSFYLYIIFLRIGFIGILGIYTSYFCFNQNKRLFFILISWILISFIIASVYLFKGLFLNYSFIPLQNIPEYDLDIMNYYFNRLWIYSIPSFSILASIGILNLAKKSKIKKKFRKKSKNFIIKNLLISIFIYLSLTGFFISGMKWGRAEGKILDSEAHIIGWASENLPLDSKILIDRYHFKKGLRFMADCDAVWINDVYIEAMDGYNLEENDFDTLNVVISYLKTNNFRYLIYSEERTNYNKKIPDLFIEDELIPNYFKEKIYVSQDITVYYAPEI